MKKSFEVIDEKFESSRNALLSYVTGFLFSLFLSIVPYLLVTEHVFGEKSLMIGVTLFAVAQLIVQVIFFPHHIHIKVIHNPH